MDTDHETIQEIYKMTRENNRMLHAMRREAFLGGIFKLVWWIVILGAGAWISATYVLPVMNQMIKTMNAVQQGGTQAQVQLGQFQDMLKGLESKIPGFGSPTTKP